MAASAVFTPEAVYKEDPWVMQFTAAAAYKPGDIVQLASGLAAVVVTLTPVASGDEVAVRIVGAFDVACASGSTWADGANVWFNSSTRLAVTTNPGASGYYLGTARGAKSGTGTVVRTMLNAGLVTLSETSIVFAGATGACSISVPNNVADALSLTDGIDDYLVITTTTGSEAILFSLAGLEALNLSQTASAVNYVNIANAATGDGPVVSAAGSDTNIDLDLAGNGTGSVLIASGTTPYVKTAAGKTNTGYVLVQGKTSGGIKLTCADAAGYTLTLSGAAIASADRTLTFPDPGGNDSVAYLALAQSLTNKTLGAGSKLSIGASTAAAGSSTADAGALPAGTAPVYPTTAADDTKGVVINVADKVTGRLLFIGNGVANKVLKVYPPSGGTINGASADAAFSSVSGKGVVILCLDSAANTWLAW